MEVIEHESFLSLSIIFCIDSFLGGQCPIQISEMPKKTGGAKM